jgi:glycosyltransferase involved in cell wall biosynthesis
MKVAIVHHARVPPLRYGGTERVLHWLIRGLKALGHQTVLVSPESEVHEADEWYPYRPDWESVLPSDTDVAHLSATPHSSLRVPFLVTIHGNGKVGEVFHRNSVFLSRKHAENHSSSVFVYNGIDPEDYPCDPVREERVVFLAKASWSVKNLEGAVQIARKAGLPLEVLGSRSLPGQLHRWIPRIRGVKYHGMVSDIEKREVLRNAKALIFPVRWHEPFGIAITEALASGCAVLGTPYGALPEIIRSSCGVLSERAKDHVRVLQGPWRFDPQLCRKRVSEGFSHLDMARSYVKLYEKLLEKGSLSDLPPRTVGQGVGLSSAQLLPWASL